MADDLFAHAAEDAAKALEARDYKRVPAHGVVYLQRPGDGRWVRLDEAPEELARVLAKEGRDGD